jgi:mono/diheme cytochrome c family protein
MAPLLARMAAAMLLATAVLWPLDPRAVAQDAPDTRRAESAAAFARIAPVFGHPRCSNCHTVTDFPRQGDDRHRHIMNVRRGPDGHGVAAQRCQACHQRANQAASGVPGADEDWHLAPLSMGWEGLSIGELCRHLLDPARNGGRSGARVVEHLGTNLVRWAWAPGVGRAPASGAGTPRTSPPVDYDTFIGDARRWIEAGAACPAP